MQLPSLHFAVPTHIPLNFDFITNSTGTVLVRDLLASFDLFYEGFRSNLNVLSSLISHSSLYLFNNVFILKDHIFESNTHTSLEVEALCIAEPVFFSMFHSRGFMLIFMPFWFWLEKLIKNFRCFINQQNIINIAKQPSTQNKVGFQYLESSGFGTIYSVLH